MHRFLKQKEPGRENRGDYLCREFTSSQRLSRPRDSDLEIQISVTLNFITL